MTVSPDTRLNGGMASRSPRLPRPSRRSSRRRTSTPRSPCSARCCSRPAPSAPLPRSLDAGEFYRESHAQDLQARASACSRAASRSTRSPSPTSSRSGASSTPPAAASACTSWRGSSRRRRTPATTRASSARWRMLRGLIARRRRDRPARLGPARRGRTTCSTRPSRSSSSSPRSRSRTSSATSRSC